MTKVKSVASILTPNRIPIVWTIGHSDSGGGTGIQADIHTFHDFNVYGCTVITAITAQNSFARGYNTAAERKVVVAQINALDSDLPASVIKLGMVPNLEVLESVTRYLTDFDGTVVYDLELDNSGEWLLDHMQWMKEQLFPSVNVLVVNVEEAGSLWGKTLASLEDMASAAAALRKAGPQSVLITGGKFGSGGGKRYDYWSDGDEHRWVTTTVVDSIHNRGGGSTLSAALSAALALGLPMDEALRLGKAYVTRGIRDANCVGSGPGSVAHHGLPQDSDDWPEISRQMPSA